MRVHAVNACLGLVLLVLLLSGSARAAALALELRDASVRQHNISTLIDILPDPTGAYTIEQVAAPGFAAQFQAEPSAAGLPDFSVAWARLRIENHVNPEALWVLRLNTRHVPWDEIKIFLFDETGHLQTLNGGGRNSRFAERSLAEHRAGCLLRLPAGRSTIYIRVKGIPQFWKWQPNLIKQWGFFDFLSYLQQIGWYWAIQGFFFGIVAIMCLYNLVLYFSSRERSHLWLIASMLGYSLYFLQFQDVIYNVTRSVFSFSVDTLLNSLAVILILFSQIEFMKHYVGVDRFTKRFGLITRSSIYVLILFVLLKQIFLSRLYFVYLAVANLLIFFMIGVTIYYGIRLVRAGSRQALLWLIATALMILVALIQAGWMGTISQSSSQPVQLLTNAFQFSVLAQIALLSLGVADKVRSLHRDRERAEHLLHNVLPPAIAARLKSDQRAIAEHFDEVSVLFADIASFTPLSARMTPQQLVAHLNKIFSQFDTLCSRYQVEKIKTIGDCYMVVAGLPDSRPDDAHALANMALDMQIALAEYERESHESGAIPKDSALKMRVGMHRGPVVAGVIGTRKLAYDLWGDTVNTASRMESHSEPDRIHCSETCQQHLKDSFVFEARGEIAIKGKGPMRTYYLLGRKKESV